MHNMGFCRIHPDFFLSRVRSGSETLIHNAYMFNTYIIYNIYIIYIILHTVNCILYTVNCIEYIIYCILCTVYKVINLTVLLCHGIY